MEPSAKFAGVGPFMKFAAAGLGGLSMVGIGYTVANLVWGIGGSSANLASEHSQGALVSPQSVPEPESVLLFGAGLLALALWHHKSISERLVRRSG